MKLFSQTIARIITVIIFFFSIIQGYSFHSVNDSPEAQILKVNGDYALTIEHVAVYEQYLEFALEQKITNEERLLIQKEIIAQFETEPFQIISEIRSIEEMLKMLHFATFQERKNIRETIIETIKDFENDGHTNVFVKIAKAHQATP